MKKIIIATIFVLIIIAPIIKGASESILSVERESNGASASSIPVGLPPVIKIGHVGHDHQLALFVAALEGENFKKYGVWLKEKKAREVYDLMENDTPVAELHLFKVSGASGMTASMERGEIELGFGGVAAIVFFRDKGSPFKIIAPLHVNGDMLVMRKDIPVKTWEDFVQYVKKSDKPVKIGYKEPIAVAELILISALKAENISYSGGALSDEANSKASSVQLVNLAGGENMLPSLKSGALEGFVMNQPQVSLAKIKGIGNVVADLSTLPPKGKWAAHPCCCIATSEEMIKTKRPQLRTFLKLICIATDSINADKMRAAKLASEWTKINFDVEEDSVLSIPYFVEYTDLWKDGLKVWADTMNDLGKFTSHLKGLDGDEFIKETCDQTILEEARKELKK